jgi:Transposase DDE domain
MHIEASLPVDQFSDLLRRLPSDIDLDELAKQTKAIQRKRELTSGEALLRLALARGPGGLSLSQTAAWAEMIGLAGLSDPAVKYRLDHSVDFLRVLMERLLAEQADTRALRWPGRILRAGDGSNIKQRGTKGTDWRVHGVFDLGSGGFSHLELTDKHGAEGVERATPVAGEIGIYDRNYARAPGLRQYRQRSGEQADFIVRVRWKAFRLRRPDGGQFSLIEHLQALPDDDVPHEVDVQARLRGDQPWLPLRLIILRKPADAAEATRKQLQRAAPRKQKKLDPRSLVAAGFVVLATSLPAVGYPAGEVLAAYRLRWQIELAFKRLKSLLHIDRLPTCTPQASRSWLYAHLVMALLCDQISQDFLESSPSGHA